MTKLEFLFALEKKLSLLPQEDVHEHLNFYAEMIEDRIEEGLSEDDAVAQIGSVEEIARQITNAFTEKSVKTKRKFKTWEITLLILGSPIWLSLLIAFFAVFISLYASLWSVVICLWACFGGLVGGAICGIVGGIGLLMGGKITQAIALMGAGISCIGLVILMFFVCKIATKGMIVLTKKIFQWVKGWIRRKEES